MQLVEEELMEKMGSVIASHRQLLDKNGLSKSERNEHGKKFITLLKGVGISSDVVDSLNPIIVSYVLTDLPDLQVEFVENKPISVKDLFGIMDNVQNVLSEEQILSPQYLSATEIQRTKSDVGKMVSYCHKCLGQFFVRKYHETDEVVAMTTGGKQKCSFQEIMRNPEMNEGRISKRIHVV